MGENGDISMTARIQGEPKNMGGLLQFEKQLANSIIRYIGLHRWNEER